MQESKSPVCIHCLRRRACKPRGLCSACYDNESIRARYPLPERPKALNYVSVVGLSGYRGLPEPTSHPPGTEGKIRVLEERAAAGLHLWHPLDAQLRRHKELYGVSDGGGVAAPRSHVPRGCSN